ncbi:GLPGLI family protein [Sphingobacterium sp. MYb382]|uniref:GLPGLI family protein n=1 Tax=Sphingobacterium sp. MYb382 TaxID=2745278 RepID=UPI0030A0EE61
MIKNIIKYLFVFVGIICLSYSKSKIKKHKIYQVLYEMKYQKDSLDEKSLTIEIMELFTNSELSLFRSYEYSAIDSNKFGFSVNRINLQQKILSTYYVTKDLKSNVVGFFDKIRLGNKDSYVYYENIANKEDSWIVTSETDSLKGFSCQKAYIDLGGRRWIAWFCNDIPISDGPYKFGNLPGLIIDIHDTTDTWRFSFLELKEVDGMPKNHKSETAKEITKEDYYSLKRNYRDNMVAIEEASNNSFFYFSSTAERSRVVNAKKISVKKDNNWIELYP